MNLLNFIKTQIPFKIPGIVSGSHSANSLTENFGELLGIEQLNNRRDHQLLYKKVIEELVTEGAKVHGNKKKSHKPIKFFCGLSYRYYEKYTYYSVPPLPVTFSGIKHLWC